MTEKLYWKDMYMREFEASVVNADGNRLILDRTIFYPASGGQINDTGKIAVNGKEYKVIDVKKEKDNVVHITDSDVNAKPGDKAEGAIDWDKRYMHMRLHTAIHVIDGIIVTRQRIEGFSTGSQIYDDRARVDF